MLRTCSLPMAFPGYRSFFFLFYRIVLITFLLTVFSLGCQFYPDNSKTADSDGDGVIDKLDNCPEIPNKDQFDLNGDGWGDVCDDLDGDLTTDDKDIWPYDPYNDFDKDGYGADPFEICSNICDTCKKLAEFCSRIDNCPADPNDQTDSDKDGLGDKCDVDVGPDPLPCNPNQDSCKQELNDDAAFSDQDSDGIADIEDLCPELPISEDPYPPVVDPVDDSVNHLNTDNDEFGDACDDDDDNDGIPDRWKKNQVNPCINGDTTKCDDNCRTIPNETQDDLDCDGIGDVCDNDRDGDGYTNIDEISGTHGFITLADDWDTDNDGKTDGPCQVPGQPPCETSTLSCGPDSTPLGPQDYSVRFMVYDENWTDIKTSWLPDLSWESGQWRPDHLIFTVKLLDPNGNPIVFSDMLLVIDTSNTIPGMATNDDQSLDNDFSFSSSNPNITQKYLSGPSGMNIIDLYAFDFGGQANITATVTRPGGVQETGYLILPVDSDGDRLPDAWENSPPQHSAGFDAYNPHTFDPNTLDSLADIDTSLNNAYAGDGLSNFQEYRGVIFDKQNSDGSITVTHKRLNPSHKDLFVRGDNYENSLNSSYTASGVMPFSVRYNDIYGISGAKSAFEEALIDVHDVTRMPSFNQASEPPNIDILVVTNKTERRPDGLIQTLPTEGSLGIVKGYINHPSTKMPRNWTWDLKGASYIGNNQFYAISSDGTIATQTYHLCLMNYFFNRPYLDDKSAVWTSPGNSCYSASYISKLDPLDRVEDRCVENGKSDKCKGNKWERNLCIENGSIEGDMMDPLWISYTLATAPLWGSEDYMVGYNSGHSVFDADGDGFVENPVLSDPAPLIKDPANPDAGYEYTLQQVQLHTVLHEMGHAVGMDPQHTSDPTCLMYEISINWSRAGHFSPLARGQILIHNK